MLNSPVVYIFLRSLLIQLNRVVRQRVRPQTRRSANIAALKATAGPQCKDICGTRAIVAKTTKIPVAAITDNQSNELRAGFGSPTTCRPVMRAST